MSPEELEMMIGDLEEKNLDYITELAALTPEGRVAQLSESLAPDFGDQALHEAASESLEEIYVALVSEGALAKEEAEAEEALVRSALAAGLN